MYLLAAFSLYSSLPNGCQRGCMKWSLAPRWVLHHCPRCCSPRLSPTEEASVCAWRWATKERHMDNVVGVLTGNEEGDSYALALPVSLSLLFRDAICCSAEASYLRAIAIVACKDTIPCHWFVVSQANLVSYFENAFLPVVLIQLQEHLSVVWPACKGQLHGIVVVWKNGFCTLSFLHCRILILYLYPYNILCSFSM